MELNGYLERMTADTEALAQAVEAKPGRPIVACPGWDVAQLSRHLGATHRWVTEIVAADTPARVALPSSDGPTDEELGDWLRTGAAQLVAQLAATGPDKSVWTMGPPRTSWYWYRRQAVETALHRWDGQNAVGTPVPIDSDLATEGIAEMVEVLVPGLHRRSGTTGSGETFHLHRTDGPGEWLVRFEEGGAVVSREHAKGDVALRAGASDLLLVLWRRLPFADVEVFGDPQVLDRWAQLVPAI